MSIISDIKEFRAFKRFITDPIFPDINNPTDFYNDAYWVSLLGRSGNSGKVSRSDLQSQLDAFWGDVYKCTSLRSNVCASVKWGIYRAVGKSSKSKSLFKLTQCRDIDRKKKDYLFGKSNLEYILKGADDIEEITNHPISRLLYKVNSQQNISTLKFLTTCYQDLTGNCYWYLILSAAGIPAEIKFLYPQYMSTNYDEFGNPESYKYKTPQDTKTIPAKQIIHFMYDNPSNMGQGVSPVAASCDTINEQIKMTELLTYLLETKLMQDTILINKGASFTPDKQKELKLQWQNFIKKKDKTIPILTGDLTPHALSQSMKDLPFLPNKKFDREEIYAIFSVPIAYATMESSNRSTIDIASDRVFMGTTIKPILSRNEETINQSFIWNYYPEDIFIAYDDCVPEDMEMLLKQREAELGGIGWRPINEIRAEDGLEPYPGGDVIYLPNGMPLGSVAVDQQVRAIIDAVDKEIGE